MNNQKNEEEWIGKKSNTHKSIQVKGLRVDNLFLENEWQTYEAYRIMHIVLREIYC